MVKPINVKATGKSAADKSRVPVKPYLVTTDEDGQFRLTVRRTRYNSQNYPLVDSELRVETFRSMAAVRAFARDEFGAEAGQFARE